MIGLVGDEGKYPRLKVTGSTRRYEQLQLRRVLITIMRMEEGLPCMKGFTVELSNGPYDLLPQSLKYVPKHAALVGPEDSVRRDSDKTFQELMHRFEACSRKVCPDQYVKQLLERYVRNAPQIFAEKLPTPKKDRYISTLPPCPQRSPIGEQP